MELSSLDALLPARINFCSCTVSNLARVVLTHIKSLNLHFVIA